MPETPETPETPDTPAYAVDYSLPFGRIYMLGADSPDGSVPSYPAPSVGRVVHYYANGMPGSQPTDPQAAVVASLKELEVDGETSIHVGLYVLDPFGMYYNESVPFSSEPTNGHWTWPPRV